MYIYNITHNNYTYYRDFSFEICISRRQKLIFKLSHTHNMPHSHARYT